MPEIDPLHDAKGWIKPKSRPQWATHDILA